MNRLAITEACAQAFDDWAARVIAANATVEHGVTILEDLQRRILESLPFIVDLFIKLGRC